MYLHLHKHPLAPCPPPPRKHVQHSDAQIPGEEDKQHVWLFTSQVAFKVLSACSSATQGLLFGSEGAVEL